jgi:hypothetical protein
MQASCFTRLPQHLPCNRLGELNEENHSLSKALGQLQVETARLGAQLATAKGSNAELQGSEAAEEAAAAARLQVVAQHACALKN